MHRSVRLAEAERVVDAAAEVVAAALAVVVVALAEVAVAQEAPVVRAAVPVAVPAEVEVVVAVKVADAMADAVAAVAISSRGAKVGPISSRMWSRSTESPRSSRVGVVFLSTRWSPSATGRGRWASRPARPTKCQKPFARRSRAHARTWLPFR